MPFELFDPNADVRITAGHLPHWYQPGVTYFVTFRTADSLPVEVADLWHRNRRDWLARHGIDADRTDWKQRLTLLSEDAQREFHNTLSDEFLTHLDKGHGECVLRRPELAKIVANSLWHFDGQRYQLGEFVVMPNHVHLLVALLGDTDIEAQCYSWKKFAATQINRVLGEKGRFWQEESFDHLVRSPEQFDCLRRYIAENGPKAGLRPGEYYHWKPGDPKDVAT
ncbi:MAG: transposase [Planctomycetota bacterium]|nr:transposase [Planctomycetota bacterium]